MSQRITLSLNGEWRNKAFRTQPVNYIPILDDSVDFMHMCIPRGVFGTMNGGFYSPTVHGETPTSFGSKTVLLFDLGGSLRAPVCGAYLTGQYQLINTSKIPLCVGDKFTVEFPSQEDTQAQIDTRENVRTRQSCGGEYEKMKPLFGGFLSTRRIPGPLLEELSYRIIRDVTDPAVSSVMTALSDINHTLTVDLAAHANVLREYRTHVTANQAAPPAANISGLFAGLSLTAIQQILLACSSLLSTVNFSTVGMCISSAFNNPDQKNPHEVVKNNRDGQTSTGMLFNSSVTNFQGF